MVPSKVEEKLGDRTSRNTIVPRREVVPTVSDDNATTTFIDDQVDASKTNGTLTNGNITNGHTNGTHAPDETANNQHK